MAYNILIVDDSPAMRRVVRRVVELSGVDVGSLLEAGDGQEALEVLHREWIDLIVSDINMPRMNGEQLLIAVRAEPQIAAIPILVLSTDASDTRVERMLAQGANGYMAKPFQPGELAEHVNRLLGVAADAVL